VFHDIDMAVNTRRQVVWYQLQFEAQPNDPKTVIGTDHCHIAQF